MISEHSSVVSLKLGSKFYTKPSSLNFAMPKMLAYGTMIQGSPLIQIPIPKENVSIHPVVRFTRAV
uniref:Bgt-20874 n=1 Tax=Blumeria graminis f. sp. tritici 96224 TaxID=1268274 RepID=A0A381L0Y1_BLUGR